MAIDKLSKSNRLLQSRRYTHDSYTDSQEAFTSTLDINANEVYVDQSLIPSTGLPFSGSAQSGSIYSVNGQNVMQYYYRAGLTRSDLASGSKSEVWFLLSNATASTAGIGGQLIDANQQTNFISPKYGAVSLANANAEDATPGYGVKVFVSAATSSAGVVSGDQVSVNNYTFDYKTGVLQFSTTALAPTTSQYVYLSGYQYKGRVLTDNITNVSASISALSASVGGSGGGSLASRVDQLAAATASVNAFTSSQEAKDLTLASYTSSINSYTSSTSARLTRIEESTSSLNSFTSSILAAITASGTNVTINGDLVVKGTTTSINSTTVQLGDNIIELNGTGASNGGLVVKDPTSPNTTSGSLLWDSTNDYWKAGPLGSELKLLRTGGDSVVSGSSQIDITATTGFTTYSSSVSASLTSTSASLSSLSASVATVTGDFSASVARTFATQSARVSSLEAFSGSQITKDATLASYTASVDAKFTTLLSVTSAYDNRFNTLEAYTSSINTKFSTLQTYTASTDARLTNLELTSASVINVNLSQSVRIDQLAAATASVNSFTSSQEAKDLTLQSLTASFSSSVGQLNAVTASLATTYEGRASASKTLFSGSSQVTYTQLSGISNNIVSGSTNSSTIAIVVASGSITANAIGGVVSGSSQITYGNLSGVPTNIVSASTNSNNIDFRITAGNITANLYGGVVSGSSQINAGSTTNFATDVKTQLNSNTVVSGSSQIDVTQTANWTTNLKTGLNSNSVVSGSSQINFTQLSGISSNIISSSTDSNNIDFIITGGNITANLYGGVVSGSSQIDVTSTTNFSSYSSSVSASLYALSASVGSGNVGVAITNLNAFTASQINKNATLATYTSSTDIRLTNLETTSASVNTLNTLQTTRIDQIGIVTASLNTFSASVLGHISDINTKTGSFETKFSTLQTLTASVAAQISRLQESTASLNAFSASQLLTESAQNARLVSLESATASLLIETSNLETFSASVLGYIADNNSKTGSYARKDQANIFIGNQTITGSLFVTQDFIVGGSSSIQNISASRLDIGDNIIELNTAQPFQRFGGIAVADSGSSPRVSGSLLFDSVDDEWIFVHKGTAAVTSSTMITGPETYDNVGNETHLTENRIPKMKNGFHVYDSNISDNGSAVSINSNTQVTGSLVVSNGISGQINATNGVVSGSIQVLGGSGIWSGSAQLPSGVISGSSQLSGTTIATLSGSFTGSFNGPLTGLAQYASQVAVVTTGTITDTTLYPMFSANAAPNTYITPVTHTSGSFYYNGVTRQVVAEGFVGGIFATNGVVSGSSQIDITATTGYSAFSSSIANSISSSVASTTWANISGKPSGIVSGSSQITLTAANNSGFSTTYVSEGTNEYYTTAKVQGVVTDTYIQNTLTQIDGGTY